MMRDHRDHETGVLWIKGSGSDMLTTTLSHFTSLRMDDLLPVNRGIKKAFPQ
jgi:rhamnose utilization protein RhaD (predicted bifunctional aldolase and dehydrogenase)